MSTVLEFNIPVYEKHAFAHVYNLKFCYQVSVLLVPGASEKWIWHAIRHLETKPAVMMCAGDKTTYLTIKDGMQNSTQPRVGFNQNTSGFKVVNLEWNPYEFTRNMKTDRCGIVFYHSRATFESSIVPCKPKAFSAVICGSKMHLFVCDEAKRQAAYFAEILHMVQIIDLETWCIHRMENYIVTNKRKRNQVCQTPEHVREAKRQVAVSLEA